ncbi:Lipase (class 3) [Marinomonas spartinae]|uniref:Lipase (Class 3) n=1 Tax=Marinomonas spartinae TaxID=1792290 RepID=A0A1A8THS9_9GAMM|nr:lipase family protein [Marinomonas spartinae]SBS31930.1 Lipase (class 3) [Marinomonas spartinae]
MKTLSPRVAVQLAEFAYESLGGTAQRPMVIEPNRVISQHFAFDSQKSSLVGVTGTVAEHVLKHSTGFGFFGIGRNEGDHAGEVVIAIRGTAGIADTLTDLHCGLTVGPNNKAVHAGFNRTFDSIKPQLAVLLSKIGSRPVHCVGHSLGGALATLAASWIKEKYKIPVKLYTFGSPRVGHSPFAVQAETSLNGVYRAVNRSDPVPMVPVWPFVHAGNEYRLSTSVSLTGAAHKMLGDSPGYIKTASLYPDYTSMEKGSLVNFSITRLKYVNRHHAYFNAFWAERITSALLTLLRESGKISSVLAQGAISGTLTLYDVIARALVEISEISSEYAEDSKGLIGHILNFVGKPGVKVVDVTYRLAKDALYWMLEKLNKLVKSAITIAPYIGMS